MNQTIQVEVIYALPEKQQLIELSLAAGSTIEQAIDASGLLQKYPDLLQQAPAVGVFSQKKDLTDTLQDGDRVEVYRPLQIDPKEARRQLAEAKKAKRAK